jgi:hypothetical protein
MASRTYGADVGINNRSSLHPRWSGHNVNVVSGFMLASIKVVRKLPTGTVTYNQVTREYTGAFETIFEGKARVQPYGIIGDQIVAQDTTGRRLMRVQIESKNSGINLDDMLAVVACEGNQELTTFSMEVRGTIGSSNEWVTDLVCEADLKRVLN